MKVGMVRVEPKTIGTAAITHNTMIRTAFSWQSDLLLVLYHAMRPNFQLPAQ